MVGRNEVEGAKGKAQDGTSVKNLKGKEVRNQSRLRKKKGSDRWGLSSALCPIVRFKISLRVRKGKPRFVLGRDTRRR